MTTYEWFQMWVLMVLAIRATRHYDKLKHDLFKAIKEYKLSDDNSIPRKRTIKLFEDIIIKHPINAKTSRE